jgi:excisionase family DNA binding protein
MEQREITISVKDALSYKDAARELGITTMTLWRWVRDNKIIAVKLGRYKFIPVSEIERIKRNRDTSRI